MRKLCLAVAVALAVSIVFVSPCFSDISLGLSVYKPKVTLVVGEQTSFAVGRIYNTGDNTIYVTSTISATPSLTVLNSNVTLAAGDSVEINVYAANITEEMVGTYAGAVEVAGHGLEPVSGNPVLPGGTLPFTVTVIGGSPATFNVFQLGITPYEFSGSETANASVSVANMGGEEGVYHLVLKLDGIVYAEQNVTIAPSMNATVFFPVSAQAGQHNLSVENVSVSFTVNSTSYDPTMLILALAPLGIVASVGIFIHKRNHKKKAVEIEPRAT